ncbi:MAG: tetratricopeptide repeat protein [Proteobacteria bacterium]|nr:tetratricopeptide repeat protein [Pseudomonadota bacterium]
MIRIIIGIICCLGLLECGEARDGAPVQPNLEPSDKKPIPSPLSPEKREALIAQAMEAHMGAIAAKDQGKYQEANIGFRKALEISTRLEEPDGIGSAYYGLAQVSLLTGYYNNALEYYRRTLEELSKSRPSTDPVFASLYIDRGVLYGKLGQHHRAADTLEKALIFNKTLHGNDSPEVAMVMVNTAAQHLHNGEYEAAKTKLIQARDIYQQHFPGGHEHQVAILSNLCIVDYKLSKQEQPLDLCEDALEMAEKIHGKNHPMVAAEYNNIGANWVNISEYDFAKRYFSKSIKIARKHIGSITPEAASALINLGAIAVLQGDYKAAIAFSKEAQEVIKTLFGSAHPTMGNVYANLGHINLLQGKYKDGIELIDRGISIMDSVFGEHHPDTFDWIIGKAESLLALGHFDEARALLEEIRLAAVERLGAEHLVYDKLDNTLGRIAIEEEKPEEARTLLIKVDARLKKSLGTEHILYRSNQDSLAEALRDLGKLEESLQLHLSVLKFMTNFFANDEYHISVGHNHIGRVLARMNRLEESEVHFRKALKKNRALFKDGHPYVADDLYHLGLAMKEMGNYTSACKYIDQALDIRVRFLGKSHRDTLEAEEQLKTCSVKKNSPVQ